MTTARPIHQKSAERRSHASSWKRHQSFVFRSPPLDRARATSFVLLTFGDANGHIHSCSGEFEQPCWHNLIKLGLRIRSLVSAKLGSWILRQTTTRKPKICAHGSARLKLENKTKPHLPVIRTCAPEPAWVRTRTSTSTTTYPRNCSSAKRTFL